MNIDNMDNSTLIQLLLKDEMPSLSFFTNISSNIVRTAVAMANENGGYIVIGVSDTKEIVGIANIEQALQETNSMLRKASPILPYTIHKQQLDGHELLVVSILEGGKKPYLTEGVFYVFRGELVCKATNEEIAGLLMQREKQDTSWERTPIPEVEQGDLSEVAYKRIYNNMVNSGYIDSDVSFDELIYKLGMKVDGHITNAGVLMFCSKPPLFIPQSRIRLSMFDGNDSLIEVRMFDEDIVSNIENIVNYISHIYGNSVTINGLEREEHETIPIVALREGLFNACVHREYDSIASFIVINIYANRLEIKNSGKLPQGLSIEELIHSHVSIIRNPDIANACQQARYIEMAGSGIPRIIESCRKNGCATPIWSSDDSTVTLTFPNVYHNKIGVGDFFELALDHIDSSSEVKEDLMRIVKHIRNHQNTKTIDLQKLIGKSNATIRRYLYILKSLGLVQYVGSRKTGNWQIVSK